MICKFCKTEFESHGNSRYCPEKNGKKDYCYTKQKSMRQKQRAEEKIERLILESHLEAILDTMLDGKKEILLEKRDIPEKFYNKKLLQSIKVETDTGGGVVYKFKNYQISKRKMSNNIDHLSIIKLQYENQIKL